MAGTFAEIAEMLTPGMAEALAKLDEHEQRASAIGTNGQTLFCLAACGLADRRRIERGRYRPNLYRITEHGKAVLAELIALAPPPPPPRIAVHDIQEAMAAHYGLELADMTSPCRCRDVAWPRQEAMYLARKLTPLSLPRIGQLFGDRDHTTVIHAIRAVEQRISERWPDTLAALEAVERRVSE